MNIKAAASIGRRQRVAARTEQSRRFVRREEVEAEAARVVVRIEGGFAARVDDLTDVIGKDLAKGKISNKRHISDSHPSVWKVLLAFGDERSPALAFTREGRRDDL